MDEDTGLMGRVTLGQLREKEEILALVRGSLEARLEELDLETFEGE